MSIHFGRVICLLLLGMLPIFSVAQDSRAQQVLSNALQKVRLLSTYEVSRTLEAKLEPGTSGTLVSTSLREDVLSIFARTGCVVMAREAYTIRERRLLYHCWPVNTVEKKIRIWDGEWIFTSDDSDRGFKMADVNINRGATFIEELYSSLYMDVGLDYFKNSNASGRGHAILACSADILSVFMRVPGKATLTIDQETGFPLRIEVRNGQSTAVMKYNRVNLNPTVSAPFFVPSKEVEYDVVVGQEKALVDQFDKQ